MGQKAVCSYCLGERDKEENLIESKTTDFFISQTKSKNRSLIDRPILKSQKFKQPLNLDLTNCDSYI